jgi:hypothetical protein
LTYCGSKSHDFQLTAASIGPVGRKAQSIVSRA